VIPPLLTEPEAAEVLNVPVSWLASLRKRGLIRFTQLGKYVRYSETQITEIIRRHQIPASKGR